MILASVNTFLTVFNTVEEAKSAGAVGIVVFNNSLTKAECEKIYVVCMYIISWIRKTKQHSNSQITKLYKRKWDYLYEKCVTTQTKDVIYDWNEIGVITK